jgi:glutamine synthetase
MYRVTREELLDRGLRQLPRTLLEAVEAFEADPLADQVFGPLKKVFVEVKHREWEEYHNLVTDWERRKYLRLF